MAERASVRNLSQPAAAKLAQGASVLDRPLVGRLTVERGLYAVVFAVALFTRFYALGVRPYHHDESIHAFYSWKITTDGPGSYQYDPVYHGPILYYSTALALAVLGDSDFTGRVSPVLFGLGLLAFAWPLRRYLGRWGALAFLILATFSPALTYFSRFLRHDIYVAFGNLLFVYCAFRYGETRTPRYLYYSSTGLAIAFCNKEDMYAMAPVLFLGFALMLLWEVIYAADWKAALRGATGEGAALLKQAAIPLVTSIFIFVTIWLVFYTSFFTHPNNWNGVHRALSYWWGQQEIRRIGGPWWYYFPLLFIYEPLIFFPALALLLGPLLRPRPNEGTSTRWVAYATWLAAAGFVLALFVRPEQAPRLLLVALALAGFTLMRRWLPDRFTRYMIIWTMGSFGFYSWAQEKVPWLLVPILTPTVILAAKWFGQLIERRSFWRPTTLVPLGAVAALTLWTLIAANYLYDAPRPAEAPGPRHAELLAYVQSTYDITDVVMKRIEAVGKALGTGERTRLQATGNATWPLSWYLRHYPVNWGADVRSVDTPVLVVDKDVGNSMDKVLLDKYEKVPFEIRGWWEPDWRLLNPQTLARYLATRVAFSPVGSSDAVMYVLKDLNPSKAIAAVAVNPPPPATGYTGAAAVLAPDAVWGQKGSGPGQFNEPRDLAVDKDGNVFVVDSKNDRIQKLGPDGKPLLAWGHEGAEPGNFKDPCGIALGSDGAVYVADTWNHRIEKFEGDGKFVLEWRPQAGFWGPRGVAVAPDNSAVYVTDTGNKRVFKFDTTGKEQGVWGHDGSKPGEFIEPVGIVVDRNGEVIVADTGNHRLQIFDKDGKFIKEQRVAGWEEFYSEPYLALLDGDLLTTDSYNHRCARYDNGTLVYSWGKSGSEPGDFNRPIGIATDSHGKVYVSDTMNHRIEKFTLPAVSK